MKKLMSIVNVLALAGTRDMEDVFYFGDRPSLPRSKKFTGARKVQRAAKKRRNRMRSGS